MAALNIIDYSAKCFVITGDTKQVKDDLKKLGGKFNPRLSCGAGWVFSVSQRAKVEDYLNGGGVSVGTQEAPAAAKADDKILLPEYLDEMRKAWDGADMIEYFKNSFSTAVRLSNGGLLVFEKPTIDKDFCFGYGMQCSTFDDANKMASHAATSEKYFLDQNLKDFDNKIKELETMQNSWGSSCVLLLDRICYYSQKAPLNVFNYFLSSCGLNYYEKCNISDMAGTTKYLENFDGIRCYYDLSEATTEDRANILAALKHERQKFEKRLKTYLKRYGLSKVRAWSYWADE